MVYYFKNVIKNYCETGKLSDDEVDFLEREHVITMNSISEMIYPSIASIDICEACNLEPGSTWIICNAYILDLIRPVKTGKQRAHKLFDALCEYKILPPKLD
tara:strand:- start:116 stop:421 length:306 start_codon:yes stop_codon:yes gene_type:complete